MNLNPIKPIKRIIDDIRWAINDPDSNFNNCSELEQTLRKIEKQLQEDANSHNTNKESGEE